MELRDRLAEVAANGAPAQSQRANALLEELQVDGLDHTSRAEAQQLIDAYLHDPYLTKNAGD